MGGLSGRDLALGGVTALAVAGIALRRGSSARVLGSRTVVKGDPAMEAVVRDLIRHDLQIGDYHREHVFVRHPAGVLGDDLFQVKLEGWGAVCVPGQGRRVAEREAKKMAKQWGRQWHTTGWFPVEDEEVWAMTWAVQGPLDPPHDLDEEEDEEQVIDLRPSGSPSISRGPYERTQSIPPQGIFPRWETDPNAFGRTPNLREVAPDLYVGAATAVVHPPGSFWNPGQAKPWDTILCLNWSEPDLGLREALGGPPPALRAGYGAARTWWCSSFIDGNRVPASVLDDALSLWAHREGPVLIHCHWGLSRSASVAAALLRLKFDLSRDEALERVRLPGVPLSDWPRVRTFDSAMRLVDGMLETRKDAR